MSVGAGFASTSADNDGVSRTTSAWGVGSISSSNASGVAVGNVDISGFSLPFVLATGWTDLGMAGNVRSAGGEAHA
jgi:hypothetical protein